MSSDFEHAGSVSGIVLAESDAEEARISDYLLFLAASAISFGLIGLGVVKLVEAF